MTASHECSDPIATHFGAHAGTADKYHKSLDETFSSEEIKSLYDVINLHVYATKPEGDRQHPWERSYPEDPSIDYLKNVDAGPDNLTKN